MNLDVSSAARVAGRFKLQRIKATTGEVVQELEFKNLITDIGLNRMGAGVVNTHFFVSTNATAPTVLDTSMAGLVAATTTLQAETTASTSSTPYWTETTTTRRFAAGAAAGNLTKVGVGWAANSVNALWSSALILDGSGNPTTLTVLSDEFLDVTYTLRFYPPLADSTYTIVLNGTTHTITSRVASVTARGMSLGQAMGVAMGATAYAGPATLGAVTSSITGSTGSAALGTFTANAYVNNSLAATGSLAVGLNSGNVSGGITGLVFNNTSGPMQFSTQATVSPAIPKDNTKSMTLAARVTWSRYP